MGRKKLLLSSPYNSDVMGPQEIKFYVKVTEIDYIEMVL